MVHGAFVSGIDYFQMHNNNIHVNSNFSTYGIYMENCTGYMLENNTLDYGSPNWFQNPVGIINYFATVNNNQNEIRNNEITNFKYSMLLEGEHRSAFNPNIGLELWCNSLKSYSKAISVTVPPGIAGIQDGPSPTTGANNLFEPYGCNFSNEGELYNPSGNNPFNYMHKLNSTTDFVEPVSGCFTATQVIPTAIQNVFDYPQDCASTTPDCNPVWRLIEPIASTNNNPVLKVSNVALIQPVFELEINKRIRYYLHDSGISNPEDSIIRLIKTTNTLGRDYLLAFAYAKIGQDSNLNIQLNSLNNDSVFTELNTISLLTDSVDWDKLKNDPARKSNLIETAMDSSKYAYTSARNVLRYVYDETFPEIIILPSTAIFQPKIARNMESSDLKIYPNPFTSEFNIELKNSNELFTLKIYNPLGVELMSISILGNKINTINFLDWPSGLYLLNIIGTEKFVFNGMINHVSK